MLGVKRQRSLAGVTSFPIMFVALLPLSTFESEMIPRAIVDLDDASKSFRVILNFRQQLIRGANGCDQVGLRFIQLIQIAERVTASLQSVGKQQTIGQTASAFDQSLQNSDRVAEVLACRPELL